MESRKKEQAEIARQNCTGHTKKSLRAIKVRSKQVSQRGGNPRLKKITSESVADSVPL